MTIRPTPVESSDLAGFYEIPQFDRYLISRDGRVMNKLTDEQLSGSRNPAGYVNYRLVRNDGYTRTMGRHRLLALVFKHPGVDTSILEVNHENGVKGDDRLDNLEWVTPKGNVEHAGAMGLTKKCCPISVRDVDTGVVTKYPSFVECARQLGLSKDAIKYRVYNRSGMNWVFPERKQYRLGHTDGPWLTPPDIERSIQLNGCAKGVEMRRVLTGEVTAFPSIAALADYLGMPLTSVCGWLRRPSQPVLPGFIQLKLATDPTPWRVIVDPQREHDAFGITRAVEVIDTRLNDVTVYKSCRECAVARGLYPTALNYRLKSNGTVVFSDGCRYRYYDPDRVVQDSNSPLSE